MCRKGSSYHGFMGALPVPGMNEIGVHALILQHEYKAKICDNCAVKFRREIYY